MRMDAHAARMMWVSRVGLRSFVLAFLVFTLGLSATLSCSSPQKQEPTPQEILDEAGNKLANLESVHFKLDAEGGAFTVGPGLAASSLEGDVLKPDRLHVKGKTNIGGMTLDLNIIAVGDQIYFANPLTRRWEKLSANTGAKVPRVLGSDGVARVLNSASNVRRNEDATIDGVTTYHLAGELDPAALASIFGSSAGSSPVPGEIWIGKDDFLVRQIRLSGPLMENDAANVVRTIHLSRFDEPVLIEAPVR